MADRWFRTTDTDDTDSGDPIGVPYHYAEVDAYWGVPVPQGGNTGQTVWFVRYFAPESRLDAIEQESRATLLDRGQAAQAVTEHLGRAVSQAEVNEIAKPEVGADA